jgi:hypothetical protein
MEEDVSESGETIVDETIELHRWEDDGGAVYRPAA